MSSLRGAAFRATGRCTAAPGPCPLVWPWARRLASRRHSPPERRRMMFTRSTRICCASGCVKRVRIFPEAASCGVAVIFPHRQQARVCVSGCTHRQETDAKRIRWSGEVVLRREVPSRWTRVSASERSGCFSEAFGDAASVDMFRATWEGGSGITVRQRPACGTRAACSRDSAGRLS